jgi:DNA-binding XRE family transcriptional regulator
VDRPIPLGERIAQYRRRRGLSQTALGQRLDLSLSWVSQVERGVRDIDKISTLRELARVLDIPPSELLPADLHTPTQEEHPAVDPVRRAMTTHGALAHLHDTGGQTAPDEAELRDLLGRAATVWDLTHQAKYQELSETLPALVPRLEAVARQAGQPRRPEMFGVLAEVYQATTEMLIKLGVADLAWVAADRAVSAAEQAGSPALIAAGSYRLARVFLAGRRLGLAYQVSTQAADALQSQVGEHPASERLSVLGALQLVATLAAARQGDAKAAYDRLRQAQATADQLGEDRNDHHTEFSTANVASHSVHIPVELGDAGEALRRAATIDVAALTPERRGRFLIDVARAHAQLRQVDDELRVLLEAEAVSPEQVRAHGAVRSMIADLLRDERYRVAHELRALARRAGVLP